MPDLTESEKERIRYHLGYLESQSAASFQLGIPRPIQTVFLLESGMNLIVSPFALERVRALLATLDALECQLIKAVPTVQVEVMGNLTLHPLRSQGKLSTDSIEKEIYRWACRLADVLGVPPYPYSKRFRRSGPGSNFSVTR